MANEEKELYNFINNPQYREKVIKRIHKDEDQKYQNRIKTIEKDISRLSNDRQNKIRKISNARWENLVTGKLQVNRTEGKIRVNKTEGLFSEIHDVNLNMMVGNKVVSTSKQKGKSKKHISVVGTIAGAAVAGPVGAVIGGAGLGKTTHRGKEKSVANEVATCTHLGVCVHLGGVVSEIVLIPFQIEQSSFIFLKAQNQAQNIISQLGILSNTPVPGSYLAPEEDQSVKEIDAQIVNKKNELQFAIEDKPTYALPDLYKSDESHALSDEEYLHYLESMDQKRIEEKMSKLEGGKEHHQTINVIDQEKIRKKTTAQIEYENRMVSYKGVYTALNILYIIICWILTLFTLLFGMVSILKGKIISSSCFILTIILINPLTSKMVKNKVFNYPNWASFIMFVVGFFMGIVTVILP